MAELHCIELPILILPSLLTKSAAGLEKKNYVAEKGWCIYELFFFATCIF